MARVPSARQCARALWLLGLPPEPTADEVNAAYRVRIAKAHPDRYGGDDGRRAASEKLARALTSPATCSPRGSSPAATGRSLWGACAARPRRPPPARRMPPTPGGGRAASVPTRVSPRATACACGPTTARFTSSTAWTRSPDGRRTTVRFLDRPPVGAHRVRLAAFSCLVCGACGGPAVEQPALRPCPECLTDLRRLEQDAAEADRIRRAIEARAAAGIAAARIAGDRRLEDRARARRRWARSLAGAEADDLQRALLGRFTQAYDAWGAASAA